MNLRTWGAVAFAALLAAAAACTDPSVAPKNGVTDANIWDDPNAYAEFLAKLYGGLIVTGQIGPNGTPDLSNIDEGFSQWLRLYWYMQEVPTDEAVIGWGDPGLPELNRDNWSASNQMIQAMYYRVYFQVTLANEFLRQTKLDLLNARGVTSALKAQIQQYRAEARWLRAYAYWVGMDFFGGIPLVTEANPIGGPPPKQVTRDSVYNYVVRELTAIRDSLPPATPVNYGRATPVADDMLLAEVHLNAAVYTGTPQYDLALNAAQAVISSGLYALDPDYLHNFMADNNTSPEIIFAVILNAAYTQTWGGMTFLVHAAGGGSLPAAPYCVDAWWGGYRLKQQAYRLFLPGDVRGSFFWTADQTDSVIDISDFSSGIAAPKFSNRMSTGACGSQAGMVDTDFPVFRLGEAYLIYAEAAVRTGTNLATALSYFNLLRERAYGNTSADLSSATQMTLDTLLAERARELLFEGRRRTDLIRFGRFAGLNVTYNWAWKGGKSAGGAPIDAKYNLYPIPQNEITANPNLKQNPGY